MNTTRNKLPISRSSSSSRRRHVVKHDYHDHAFDKDDSDASGKHKKPRKGPRGGVTTPFPVKLHMLLEQNEFDDIISWQPHGRCFLLHDPKKFLEIVMPKSFKQTKLTSFQRQLNLYGFSRLTSGPDKGGYYHELFLRGKRQLCSRMIRMRIKGTRTKAASDPESEPDFYSMPPIVYKSSNGSSSRKGNRKVAIKAEPQAVPIKTSSSRNMDSYQISPVCVSMPSSVSSSIPNSRPNSPLTDPPFLPPVLSSGMGIGTSTLRPPISNAFSHHRHSHSILDRHPASNHEETPQYWPSLHDLSRFPDPLAQDDTLMFEGKGFHYLDSSAFSFDESDDNIEADVVNSFDIKDSYFA